MKPRELAISAVAAALLVAVQLALSFVAGVELVTAVFAAFCYVFGARSGVLTGLVFSLLRCLIFGFVPNVVLLYFLYYSLFALVFGAVGRVCPPAWLCEAALVPLAAASAFFAVRGIPVSAVYKARVSVMLWVLFGIFTALAIFALFARESGELVAVTSLAALMTVLFTLADDLITPLMLGYSREAAAGYFYSGFIAMLPQTVCAVISVFVLFYPLKRAMTAVKNGKR